MIVSHQHQFVMLAPWKTASSTAHRRLSAYNESTRSRFYHYSPHLQKIVHQHLTYADFRGLPEFQLGYYTATFVRNPYDRVYSGFLQLQRDIEQQRKIEFPSTWVKSVVMRQLSENFAQLSAGEFDFDKWWALVDEHQIYVSGRNTSFPLHPACYWTGVDGQLNVDFIGKVEAFEEDFDAFCLSVGLPIPPDRLAENVTDDLSAQPSPIRYAERMNAYSRSKIEALFSCDFQLFGYETFVP